MTHGPEAVHELIEESGLSYPVTVHRLEREHALANLLLDEKGNTAMLSEVFARGGFDRFESRSDMEEKVGAAIEAELRSRETGLISRIKRTFTRR
jgi:hypothetical protein